MTASVLEYATKGEARIARRLVRAALADGYSLSVYDGEEWTVKRATKSAPVLEALCSTGSDTLRLRDADGNHVGSFLLIWGNDESGEELLADYSDNDLCNRLAAIVNGETVDA